MVKHAHTVVEFLEQGFGAEELYCLKHPDGTIWHSQVKVGDSMIMLADVRDEYPAMPSSIYVYVPDVDAVFARALKAGGTEIMSPEDRFYGDRSGGVRDPAGNVWWIGTHKEDVAPAELERRAAEELKKRK
jgi:uncharacterized glyoxalase superfamily protein PhnB